MRTCFACGGTKTTYNTYPNGTKYPIWYLNHDKADNVVCTSCYNKYIRDVPKARALTKKWREANKNKRIQYKGRRFYVSEEMRTGVCSACGKSVEKGEISKTNIHHLEYDDSNPMAHTVELCVGCHSKETWALGQNRKGLSDANRKLVYNRWTGKSQPRKSLIISNSVYAAELTPKNSSVKS